MLGEKIYINSVPQLLLLPFGMQSALGNKTKVDTGDTKIRCCLPLYRKSLEHIVEHWLEMFSFYNFWPGNGRVLSAKTKTIYQYVRIVL